MWNIVEMFVPCVDVLLYVFFFTRCLKTKKSSLISAIGFPTLVYVIIKTVLTYVEFGYERYISIALSLLFCSIVYEGNIQTYLIWILISIVLNGIVDFFVLNVALVLPDISYASFYQPSFVRTMCILASRGVLFLSSFLMTIKLQKSIRVRWSNAVLLMCIPLGCWALLETFIHYSNAVAGSLNNKMLPILGGVGLLTILMTATMLYNHLVRQEKEFASLQVTARMAQLTNKHIEELKMLQSRLSSLQHDLKNHFVVIAHYCESKDYEALLKYVNAVYPFDHHTMAGIGNAVLDAFVNVKAAEAEKKGIEFDVRVALPGVMPISEVELSILFGNLLDNAFEAVEALPADKKRFIKIATKTVESYWVIACRNSADDLSIMSLKRIPSSKQGGELHGLGTQQIYEIATKTGGYVTFEKKNGAFTTIVMLMFPKKETATDSERKPDNG